VSSGLRGGSSVCGLGRLLFVCAVAVIIRGFAWPFLCVGPSFGGYGLLSVSSSFAGCVVPVREVWCVFLGWWGASGCVGGGGGCVCQAALFGICDLCVGGWGVLGGWNGVPLWP